MDYCPVLRVVLSKLTCPFRTTLRRNNKQLKIAFGEGLTDHLIDVLVSKTITDDAESSARLSKNFSELLVVVKQDRCVLYLHPFFSSDDHDAFPGIFIIKPVT